MAENYKVDRPCDWCGRPGPYGLNNIYSFPNWASAAMCDECKKDAVRDDMIVKPPAWAIEQEKKKNVQ